jgi:hypothetical protein
VQNLTPVWAFSTNTTGGHESPPIVNDGVMFITAPGNRLYALDAQNGDLLWRYQHTLSPDRIALHDTNFEHGAGSELGGPSTTGEGSVSGTRCTPGRWWRRMAPRRCPRGSDECSPNDPGIGVVRHADAGYDAAVETAAREGLRLPMRES